MVKILDFNCEEVRVKSCVYVFFDLHLFGFSLETITIMYLGLQYLFQWLHYDNLWKITN